MEQPTQHRLSRVVQLSLGVATPHKASFLWHLVLGRAKVGPGDPRGRGRGGRVSWSLAHLLTCSPAPAICSDPDLRAQPPAHLPPLLSLSPEASMGTQDAHKQGDWGIEYQWQLLFLLGGWERLF